VSNLLSTPSDVFFVPNDVVFITKSSTFLYTQHAQSFLWFLNEPNLIRVTSNVLI
jgi:hypothetical protein